MRIKLRQALGSVPGLPHVVLLAGELVDMALGSGAVKITPAHDPKDFQCGKRNKASPLPPLFALNSSWCPR